MKTKISLKPNSTQNEVTCRKARAVNSKPTKIQQAEPGKFCKRCKTTKPISGFGNHARTLDGLQPLCRDCMGDVRRIAHAEKKMKVCPKCNTKQSQEAFSKNSRASDGLQSYCKSCMSAYKKNIQIQDTLKTCSRCQKAKDKGLFNKCKSARDGLHSWCKTCMQEYDRQRSLKRQVIETTQSPQSATKQSQAPDPVAPIFTNLEQSILKQEQAMFKVFDKIAEKYLNDRINRFIKMFAAIGKEIFDKTIFQQILRNK